LLFWVSAGWWLEIVPVQRAVQYGEIEFWFVAPFSIALGIILTIGGNRRFEKIRPREPAIFEERFASGFSERIFLHAGASRFLTVAVTQGSIYIFASVPVHTFSDTYDLMHSIPIASVTSCESRRRDVRLCWQPDHVQRGLRLRLHRADQFVGFVLEGMSRADQP